MAEILLAHGRKMTPQVKEEIAKNVLKILQEHGIDIPVEKLPQWVVDPVWEFDEETQRATGKIWIGGLPPPTLVPSMDDPDYEDDPEGV